MLPSGDETPDASLYTIHRFTLSIWILVQNLSKDICDFWKFGENLRCNLILIGQMVADIYWTLWVVVGGSLELKKSLKHSKINNILIYLVMRTRLVVRTSYVD